jgi:D-threonate/D-erythronate kinase
MSKQPIFVIADDLTGAADAANYFRTPSHRVRVTFNPRVPFMFSLGQDVVQVFDAESRGIDEATAVQRVFTAGHQLAATLQGPFLVYKKIDSTLRGHIGSEIEALLRGLGRRIAVVAPAFPANGRSVRDGVLQVNGVPISQTAFAKDPRHPVTQDKAADLIQTTTRLPVVHLSGAIIKQGNTAVTKFLDGLTEEKVIVVADAETDTDLAIIAATIAEHPEVLPCGSAGLAKPLAALWIKSEPDPDHLTEVGPQDAVLSSLTDTKGASLTDVKRSSLTDAKKPSPTACSRVLIAVGSANPTAHMQLAHAASALGVEVVEMQPVRLASAAHHHDEMKQAKEHLTHAADHIVGLSLSEERALREPDVPGSFESDLADVIFHWVQTVQGSDESSRIGFVATGGDTALALCEALSASAIWPEGEVMSGMPWSLMETPHGYIPLISKAGGFGDADALQKAAQFLISPSPAAER